MLQNTRRQSRGYTLVEVVTALAMFTVIMLAITQIFARGFGSYRMVKDAQAKLETAQFAINLLAKELRTSSIVSNNPLGTNPATVKFYDYSQAMCIEYVFDQGVGEIQRRATALALAAGASSNEFRDACAAQVFGGAAEVLLTGMTAQAVNVIPSTPRVPDPTVGRVTVSVTVGTGASATTLQTTVSLRDFNYVGI